MKRRFFHNMRDNFLGGVITTIGCATVLIVIAGNSYLFDLQKESIRKHITDQGRQLTTFLAITARLGTYTENMESLAVPVMAAMTQQNVVDVEIFNATGERLIHQTRLPAAHPVTFPPAPPPDSAPPADAATIFTETEAYFLFQAPVIADIVPYTDTELLLNTAPQPRPAPQQIGMVRLIFSKETLHREDRALKVNATLAGLLLIVSFVLVCFFVLNFFTKPLVELLRDVSAAGVADIPPPVGNRLDLRILTQTYTSLVEALTASFDTIRKLHLEMEDKVDQRTSELLENNLRISSRHQHLEIANRRLEYSLETLQATQSQMVQTEKMAAMGQLVAGVAHEVNNTVNFVSGALPLLRRLAISLWETTANTAGTKAKWPEELEDIISLIDNMGQGTDRTMGIVRDLQDFARTEGSELQYFSPHEGLDSTLAILLPQYKSKRINIIREYHPQLPMIVCFASQLNQVFMNILKNSVQAIPDNGWIRIATTPGPDTVTITITDNGTGIEPHLLPKIFDPFFTTKPVGQGTGLGLSICYQIIRRHDGTISARNTIEGGTEFTIVLPLTVPPPPAEDAAPPGREKH